MQTNKYQQTIIDFLKVGQLTTHQLKEKLHQYGCFSAHDYLPYMEALTILQALGWIKRDYSDISQCWRYQLTELGRTNT